MKTEPVSILSTFAGRFLICLALFMISWVGFVQSASATLIDDFNRADSADVGNGWEQPTGATDIWSISGNKLRAQTTGEYYNKYIYRPVAEYVTNTQVTVDLNASSLGRYPQVLLRGTDFDTAPTGYLFYISDGSSAGPGTGVIRLINNSWTQVWSATTTALANHNYRMITSAQTNGSQVDLSFRILDLENGNAEIFNQTWSDTGATRIVSAGRQGLSGYLSGTILYDNFDVTNLDIDITSPVISSVTSSTTETSATVTWTSNEASTSTIQYGTSTSYGSTSSSLISTTAHTILIDDLEYNTLYHFRILSWDAAGNATTSGDYTFRTGVGTPLSFTSPLRSVAASSTVATIGIVDESGETFYIPYIQTGTTFVATATVSGTYLPAGGGVEFVLNEGLESEQTVYDVSSPFSASFSSLAKGIYTLNAYVVDSGHVRQGGEGQSDVMTKIGIGDIIVAVGASVTEGYTGFNYGTTATDFNNWLDTGVVAGSFSADQRNYPQHGSQGRFYIGYVNGLNDKLSQYYGYPVFLMNEGRYGYNSSQYISYMNQAQWANREALLHPNKAIIDDLAANDASGSRADTDVEASYNTIIDNLHNTYGIAYEDMWLSKPSWWNSVAIATRELTYLDNFDHLVSTKGMKAGPNFYAFFEEYYASYYSDSIHPTVNGFAQMSRLHHISMIQPRNVTVSQSAGTVTLAWDDLSAYESSISKYYIKYGTSPGVYTTTTEAAATSTTLSSLTNGQTYYFTVSGHDDDANLATPNETLNATEVSLAYDASGPSISSIASSTSPTTATVTWATNESSTSTVEYGITTGYGSASSSAFSVTSHSIVLTGLSSNTAYHFRVLSQDAAGNVTVSSDGTFTTPDATSPSITAFTIPSTSDSLTVPISVFTATDNTSVTGYLVTESSAVPALGDSGWSASPPASYVFTSQGSKILYAWAKDGVGNVSVGSSASVTIRMGGGGGAATSAPYAQQSQEVSRQTTELLQQLGAMNIPTNILVKLKDDWNPNTQEDTTIYYIGTDGKRHIFPNEKVYRTWYPDFSAIKTISPADLSNILLGENVSYRPGVRMVKFQTDPRCYAVSKQGILRWVQTEQAAEELYGDDWNTKIDDVSDAFFSNYSFGETIFSASQFDVGGQQLSTTMISENF